jgi:hypothetical protein
MPSNVRAILSTSFVLVMLLGLAACNSKNPDALNAAQVDENYAANESNFAENVDAAVAANVSAPAVAQQAENAAESNSEMNVDQAVNILHQADNDMNEYCEAQEEATGESDCDDD